MAAPGNRGRRPWALPCTLGRLDAVDLTQRLSRKEEARLLGQEQQRLLRLRLALGGQLGDPIGPPLCVV